jgi:hypothetical protein
MSQDHRAEPRRKSAPDAARLDAKALARSRRDALRRRAHRIRRSVAAVSAALFVAAFLAIYVQLASGHDPALAARSTTTSTATSKLLASERAKTSKAAGQAATATSEASTEGSTSAEGSASSEGSTSTESSKSSESEAAASSESATPVTTSQS